MSVYYYVTRKSGPFRREGPQISPDEWRVVVHADQDLSIEQPEDSSGLPRNAVWAVWRSYPGGYPAWFGLIKGDIEVKGVDDELLNKLRMFASSLNARIFCEDGEAIE